MRGFRIGHPSTRRLVSQAGSYALTGQASSLVAGGGGSSASGTEQDWIDRSTAAGVVRALRFDSAANVNAFRFSDGVGHDPSPTGGSTGSYVRWNPTGGILGDGCLEMEQLTGGNMNSVWWLPFDNTKATYEFNETGYNRGPGEGFYVQVRMKTNCGGVSSTGGGGRKMFSVSRLTQTYTANEIVYQDTNYRGIAQMYQGLSGSGASYAGFEEDAGGGDFNLQPGGDYNTPPAFCSYQAGDYVNQAACWDLHNDEWITYLLHVIPSDDNTANGTVELYAAASADTAYTLIMSKSSFTLRYDADKPDGYNALILWIYETGRTAGAANQIHQYDQVIVSTSPIACPRPLPTWFSSSLNTWFSTATKPQDAMPSAHSGWFAYSGGACGDTEVFLFGGGHGDSSFNGVISVNLDDDAPAFTLRDGGTASPAIDVSHQSDGRPNARHSSWDVQVITQRNRLFTFGGWAYYDPSSPTSHDNVDAFNLATDTWEAEGTYTEHTGLQAGNAPNAVCQDDSGNVYVWENATGDLLKWTQSTATWSTLVSNASGVIYNTPIAYDRTNNRIVMMHATNGKYCDLSDNSVTAITWTGAQSAAAQSSSSFFWVHELSAFLMKPFGSSTFYKVDPDSFAVTTYSVSGTAPTPASDGVNNIYGRCGYCPRLKIVYDIEQVSTDLHAFRVG